MAKDKSPGSEPMRPEDPYRPRSFGSRPVVGQSKPYVSGGQAHGKHEKPRGNVAGAGHIPLGGPFKKD